MFVYFSLYVAFVLSIRVICIFSYFKGYCSTSELFKPFFILVIMVDIEPNWISFTLLSILLGWAFLSPIFILWAWLREQSLMHYNASSFFIIIVWSFNSKYSDLCPPWQLSKVLSVRGFDLKNKHIYLHLLTYDLYRLCLGNYISI